MEHYYLTLTKHCFCHYVVYDINTALLYNTEVDNH